MASLWARLSLAAAMSLAGSSLVLALGTEPPADAPAAAPATPECKEADPAKCPPAQTQKAPEAAPAQPACAEADKTKCPQKQSFLERYHAAVALIEAARYNEALAAMQALDDGNSADVINYIGYIHRKLGHMAQAQMYYEAALHMQPNHRGALEYYGEWYCMMGNLPKARQNLALIASLYGTGTREYAALARMIGETQARART